MSEELEKLYMPWAGQAMPVYPISKNVYYLGHFMGYGPIWARHAQWSWQRRKPGKCNCKSCRQLEAETVHGPKANVRSQIFQEKSLDKTLADLKDCLIFSTTASYYSQFQNACLLRSRGFQLLADSCYRHPAYKDVSRHNPEHPGIPDRHHHWEHIWFKVLGEPKELGLPESFKLNNCGVDGRVGLENIQGHDSSDRRHYLAVGWLARGVPFPKGWKRFYSAMDYKLGHNFELISESSKVQTCPHNFDLSIFDNWQPDFEKWLPA